MLTIQHNNMTYADLKASTDALAVKLEEFKCLSAQTDHKSNQRKARLLSVQIAKDLKAYRAISVAIDKIPER